MAGHEVEWRRRLAGALIAVVAVGLVIGGVLGAVAYSTARVAGLVEEAQAPAAVAADQDDSGVQVSPAVSPSPTPRAPEEVEEDRAGQDEVAEGRKTAGGKKAAKHPRKKDAARAGKRRPTLNASPREVRRMGRIHLVGRYPGHAGARLAVQRLEGGRWVRFPVSVTVRSGRFRTWVASGQRGVNRFRVVDIRTRRASEPVTVRIR